LEIAHTLSGTGVPRSPRRSRRAAAAATQAPRRASVAPLCAAKGTPIA